jgi:hypothetical protein
MCDTHGWQQSTSNEVSILHVRSLVHRIPSAKDLPFYDIGQRKCCVWTRGFFSLIQCCWHFHFVNFWWMFFLCGQQWKYSLSLPYLRCWFTSSFSSRPYLRKRVSSFFSNGATAPSGPGFPHYRGLTIVLRHTTLGRIPLDEWSARRRDLFQTTRNTHKRQIPMSPKGFESTIAAMERPQTHALDRAATGVGMHSCSRRGLGFSASNWISLC